MIAVWQLPAGAVGKIEIRADLLLIYSAMIHAVDVRTLLDGNAVGWQIQTTGRRPDPASLMASLPRRELTFRYRNTTTVGLQLHPFAAATTPALKRRSSGGNLMAHANGQEIGSLRASKSGRSLTAASRSNSGNKAAAVARHGMLASSWTALWRDPETQVVTLFVLDEVVVRAVDTATGSAAWPEPVSVAGPKGLAHLPSIYIAGGILFVTVPGEASGGCRLLALSPHDGRELWRVVRIFTRVAHPPFADSAC